MLTRRGVIGGLIGLIAAPAIVRVASIMPVRVINPWDWIPHADERGYTLILHPSQFLDLMQYARDQVDDLFSTLAVDEGNLQVYHYSGTVIRMARHLPLIA